MNRVFTHTFGADHLREAGSPKKPKFACCSASHTTSSQLALYESQPNFVLLRLHFQWGMEIESAAWGAGKVLSLIVKQLHGNKTSVFRS